MMFKTSSWDQSGYHIASQSVAASSVDDALKTLNRGADEVVTCYYYTAESADFASIPNISKWSMIITQNYPNWTHRIIEFV